MNDPFGSGESADIHRRIAAALADLVTQTPGVPPHPYLSRHLAEHAAKGHVLDDAHVPPAVLAWDTSASVRRLLHRQDAPHEQQQWLQAWAAIEPFARNTDPASRLTSLHLARHAATCRRKPPSHPAAQAAAPPGSPVTALWSDCSPPDNVWAITDTAITSLAAVTTRREGPQLVSGDDHGVVQIWRTDGTAAAPPLSVHQGAVTHLLPLGPDRLATASTDGTVTALDVRHNPHLHTLHRRPGTWVTSLTLYRSPGSPEVLLAAHNDGFIAVLDADTYRPVDLPLPVRKNTSALLATVQSDAGTLLLFAQDNTVYVFDGRATFLHSRHRDRVRALTGLPGPGRYAVGDEAGNITLHDLTHRPSRETVRATLPQGSIVTALFVVTVEERPVLVSAGTDGTVRMWSTSTAQPVGDPLRGHTAAVTAMSTLPGTGPTRLITAGGDHALRNWLPADHTVRPSRLPWRPLTAAALAQTPAHEPPPFLAVASGTTTRLFNIRTGNEQAVWEDGRVTALAWVQRETQLLVAAGMSDNSIRLTDPAKPYGSASTRHLTGHYAPALALEPLALPGQPLLASASGDGTVRLWDVKTGAAVAVFEDHTFSVRALASAHTAAGLLLASGGADGKARLWNPHHLSPHGAAIRCGQQNVNAVTFVPAESGAGATELATAGQDGTIKLWDIQSEPRVRGGGRCRDLRDGPLTAVTSFPHHGKRTVVAAAGRTAIHLWDVTLDRVILKIITGHPLFSLTSRTQPRDDGPATVITATGQAGTTIFRLHHDRL
ncbi:WD40 repeat domain-containing protein [Streptomyces sp. NPDC101150]|uniref:WD40 repeat domain-containing protein n=1 Tax=Streptomyces sp. NPDC101150 TaxID=3366114 RepID=UPI0037F1C9DD